ncbi:PucR family transcriptional regulator [Cytobacillus praedii]|uniref:PucR family transcriptional regulator n=1 Tax=Cytobacillus praedii TaxID=1742358 RepID=UPI003F7F9A48
MITVEAIAKVLEKENIKLVGGMKKVDREISYITSLELTEKTSRIKENGFVLSTFHAFKDVEQIIAHLVWLIDEIKISAIGFHTASMKAIPQEVIKFANARALPLFEIPEDIPYYMIFEKFNWLMNEKENEQLAAIYKLNEKLIESVLLEKDLNSIVKVIGEHINNIVCVLDPYFELIAFWKKKDQTRSQIKYLIELIINQNKENVLKVRFTSREATITVKDEMAAADHFKVFPLFSNMNFLGYMLICQEGIHDKYSEEVIKNGIRALSMAAHNKNTLLNYQKRKDIKLFERIFQGDASEISASDFYIDLKKVTCIFQVKSYSPNSLQTQLQMFSELFIENHSNSRIWIYNKKIVGVIEIACQKEKMADILSNFPDARIGVSSIEKSPEIKKLQKMYEQSALALTHCHVQNKQLVFWEKIGIEKMAYHIQPNSLFDRLDEEILDPLISYDREKSANLTETLYVYLKHFFNLQKSSSELFVHPNTIKYRMQKINQLLQINIQNPTHYSMLMLAYSLYHYKQRKDN